MNSEMSEDRQFSEKAKEDFRMILESLDSSPRIDLQF